MAITAPFVFGPITFTEDECPSKLLLPSGQSLAIHDYIGGRRVIQRLGIVWKTISWEGMFRDNNAFDRSDIVERLKSNGTVVTLSFLSYVLDVVVKDYEPEIDNPFRIDYKITVEVSRDRSGKTTSANTTSADSQISAASKNAVSNYNILAGTNTNVTA